MCNTGKTKTFNNNCIFKTEMKVMSDVPVLSQTGQKMQWDWLVFKSLNFEKKIQILSNKFHQINFIIYFISPNQFHFINFILPVSFYQFHQINFNLSNFLSILSKKFILYTLELISSKYSKFLHSVEGEENPPFSACMDLAIKNRQFLTNASSSKTFI